MNPALLLLALPHAQASDLVWEGYFRSRGQLFDSLSLVDATTNENSEGLSLALDNRLSLRPTWRINEHASIHAQLDLVPFTVWGSTTDTPTDPATGSDEARATADGVTANGPELVALRAWGEASTPIGTFRAGRMPLEWGAGILWNAGDLPENEYGDTADRFSYTNIFGPVWVMAAFDVQYEGLVNSADDMQALSLALGYRGESVGAGLLNNYRYQPSLGWQAYTGDLWGYTRLGPLTIELEAVARFGGGSQETGANDLTESAFGGLLDASLQQEKLGFGVQGGFATGDSEPNDTKLHTFSFDPDHDVALMMFEEKMPTLVAAVPTEANGGRDTSAVQSGDGISNALYLRPRVSYLLRPDVKAELSWTTATVAKASADTANRKGYGNEIDLSLRYDPFPHVWAKGTVGMFLPGRYYSEYEDPDLGGGFDKTSFAARLMGTVEF